jgi:hypothetical protein
MERDDCAILQIFEKGLSVESFLGAMEAHVLAEIRMMSVGLESEDGYRMYKRACFGINM